MSRANPTALELCGYPRTEDDGTMLVRCENRNGEVVLTLNGHAFVKCTVLKGKPVVQVIDCDTGVVFQTDFGSLCWRR